MQRLNAVFSYIENEFDFSGEYFDVDQLSRAKQLASAGAIKAVTDRSKLMDAAKCANLLDYTLAVTEFPASNESAVTEVFGRSGTCRIVPETLHARDHVQRQVKSVDLVQYRHIERRRGRAFLLVTTNVQVVVIRATIC